MTQIGRTEVVQQGFEDSLIFIPLGDIEPLRATSPALKLSPKYLQVLTSVREVGIVEPPVVSRIREKPGKFLLLDGRLRIEALKELGEECVTCLVSTDDEAYTYNKRVNRLSTVQEHRMILTAIERGVPEERIAKALNVNVAEIQRRKRLLRGICPAVIEMIKDKRIALNVFVALRKMLPERQIAAVELMAASGQYTIAYANALLAATPSELLADQKTPKAIRGLSTEQVKRIEHESSNVESEFRSVEHTYGTDQLDLVIVRGYLGKLLDNHAVEKYLTEREPEILAEFRVIAKPDLFDA